MGTRSRLGFRLLFALAVVGCGGVAQQHQNEGAAGSSAGGAAGGLGSGIGGGAGTAAVTAGGNLAQGGVGVGKAGETSGDAGAGNVLVDAGSGGAGGASGDHVELGRSSWDVAMKVTITNDESEQLRCTRADFTLHVEPEGDVLAIISGRDGLVLVGELARASAAGVSASYGAKGGLTLPTKGDCEVPSVEVTQLSLAGVDDDSDGLADRLEGYGKGQTHVIEGDVAFAVDLSFELAGSPDVARPSLLVPKSLHPLDGVLLAASEPIALDSTVTLNDATNAANHAALTGYTASDGAFGRFSSTVVMPFGSTWSIAATGADLAGLPFATDLGQVRLLADPGLFAQDGFESTPKALLSGGAAVVTSLGTLPALAGTKSLLVPPSGAATLHLASSADIKKIRFKTRTLSTESGFSAGTPPVEIATIGGTKRLVLPARPTSAAPIATGDATWPYAAPTQDYDLPLVEPGKEVVIRIAAPWSCGGFCPPPQAFLVDDFAVE